MLIKETETWWLLLLEDCRNQSQASKKVQNFWERGWSDMTDFLANLKLERTKPSQGNIQLSLSLHCRFYHSFFCATGIGSFYVAYFRLDTKGRTFYDIEACHAKEHGWWPNVWQLERVTMTWRKDLLSTYCLSYMFVQLGQYFGRYLCLQIKHVQHRVPSIVSWRLTWASAWSYFCFSVMFWCILCDVN